MAKLVNLFKGTTGINNKVDSVRLRPEELSSAVDVDISKTGAVSRRNGFISVLEKEAHSLFSCGNYCLFVSGTDLCVLNPDYTWATIKTVTHNAKMDYYKLGNSIYYLNGYDRGIITDKVYSAWDAADYVGPDTTKVFSNPPTGTLLDLYNGRMFIAKSDILWYSEPFAYAWFNLARGFIPMPGKILLLRAVKNGIFVSTEDEQFFLEGKTVDELSITKVAEYPAIKRTVTRIDFSEISDGSIGGLGLIWASEKGICLGSSTGEFKNISQAKLDFTGGKEGAGLVKDGKYIVSF